LSVKAKLFHHDPHARNKGRPEDLLPLVESGDSCPSVPRGGHALAPTTSEAPLFVFRTKRFVVSRSLFFGAVLTRLFATSPSLCFGRPLLFGEEFDCEEPRPATLFPSSNCRLPSFAAMRYIHRRPPLTTHSDYSLGGGCYRHCMFAF
jgi:hypothetical protein